MINIKQRNYRIFQHCAELWDHWKRKHPQLVDFCIEASVDPEAAYIISTSTPSAFNYKEWINED